MSSATSKKALGEALDSVAADFKSDAGGKQKPNKDNSNNKGGKTTKLTPESKQLQKDIKAFLVCTSDFSETCIQYYPMIFHHQA